MRPLPANDLSRRHAQLATLVLIRWMAIGGQAALILVVELAVGSLPLLPMLAAVGASVALNGWLMLNPGGMHRRLDEDTVAWHLAFDTVQLAALLALSGGLTNPFCLFLLAPAAVAAATLGLRGATGLALLAVAALAVVALWHQPLPWPDGALRIPRLYLFAMAMALLLGILSVCFFTWRMAQEARQIAAAYAESRVALAQEQRVSDVGALAAAVAHELNTPLGTICLIASDLRAELRGGPHEADIQTLINQAERCRDTLAQLTHGRERDTGLKNERVPFPALVEMAAAPHMAEAGPVQVLFDHCGPTDQPSPWVERSPAVLHGLGNFIHNAIQFAAGRVEVDTAWNAGGRSVRITDDGPGFPTHLLERLGEPYLSARETPEGHLGLGVFIAVTLLERTGARVRFANLTEGGAEISVQWGEEEESYGRPRPAAACGG